ncbi:hypothetical protein CEXT_338191 [Caerostris extrusa]|uniref:Uncharacterized protein n=1 Tax=Caerostris extrusa TaxID=172846 RepID=A0AAV4VDU4_CAEEX|nr:hypothetical protein CEXT_338191 [Caerostris extrusa]
MFGMFRYSLLTSENRFKNLKLHRSCVKKRNPIILDVLNEELRRKPIGKLRRRVYKLCEDWRSIEDRHDSWLRTADPEPYRFTPPRDVLSQKELWKLNLHGRVIFN